jgi:hypothetical protein
MPRGFERNAQNGMGETMRITRPTFVRATPLWRIACASVVFLVVPIPAPASDFLVIGDGVTESSVVSLLGSRGHSATLFAGTDASFDGTADLTSYDAVILLNGEGYTVGMPTSGQEAM